MPQLYRIGSYIIFFWSNENMPLEPIHVHISEGKASANATNIWITSTGKAILSHNSSNIKMQILRKLIRFIEANSKEIEEQWIEHFGEIRYFC